MRRVLVLLCLAALPAAAEKEKLSEEERVILIRGLTAEQAKAKVLIPRSKKPLEIDPKGVYAKDIWADAAKELGPAARAGELIEITRVQIRDDRLELELNHGMKSGKKWSDRIQVGVGNSTSPIGRSDGVATAGTNIALVFPERIRTLDVSDVKRMLAPVLDFDKRTVTENYMETLPEPIRKAIAAKKVVEGMDREQVILAVGRPVRKERRTVDGDDLEEWVFGRAPGRITFVIFEGSKVSKVKEAYAGLGGSTAPELPVQ